MEYRALSTGDKRVAAGKIETYKESQDSQDAYSSVCLCGVCGCACFCLCFGVSNADPARLDETEDAELEKELLVTV